MARQFRDQRVVFLGPTTAEGRGGMGMKCNEVTREVIKGGTGSPPDSDALAAERAWVHAMKESIESHLDAWVSATKHSDSRVRLGAAHLLAGISLHPRWRKAGKAVHRMLALCSDEKEREQLRYIIEEMD